jgi:transcriptional regulator GlxA family with amidase domain
LRSSIGLSIETNADLEGLRLGTYILVYAGLLEHKKAATHFDQEHNLDALAERVMMTRRTFTRQFHNATGMPVGDWLLSEKLQRSQELLESTELPINLVVGYRSLYIFKAIAIINICCGLMAVLYR